MGRPLPVAGIRIDPEGIVRDVIALASGSWEDGYRGDANAIASFTVSRAMALVTPSIDCVISFGRVSLASIGILNRDRVAATSPGGYPLLRSRLSTDPLYDSVPLSIGRSGRGTVLWDGHHRLETYRAAGRADLPAWIATFRRGSGLMSTE